MISPLGVVRGAAGAAWRFARARLWLVLAGAAVYGLAAAVPALLQAHLPRLQGPVAGQLAAWGVSLPMLILATPIWTALYRFVILKDSSRAYAVIDVRFWRVLLAGLVLSFIGLFGSLSLVVGTVLMTGQGGRRLVVFAIIVASALVRVAAWWIALRLAIAPPLGAAGVRPRPLDAAYSYTQGAVWRILATRVLIYLPMFLAASAIFLAAHLAPRLQAGTLVQTAEAILFTAITACSDLLDGAAMALVAVQLVQARRSATLAEAAQAAA